MGDSRKKKSIRNVIFGILVKILTLILTFITRTVIVKQLGTEYAGLNTLFTSIISFLNLTELGVGSALVFTMYAPVASNDEEKICALLNLYKRIYHIIGMLILSIGVLLIPFLSNLVNGNYPSEINIYSLYSIYLVNTVLSYFLFSYRGSLFIAFQRTDLQSKIMMFTYALTSIVQILVLIIFRNYYIYAIFNPIYTILQNILIAFLSNRYFPNIGCRGAIPYSEIKKIFTNTFALTGHKIGGTIVSSLDAIVISTFLGLTAIGKYGNYYTILAALMGFISIGMQSILPSIGNFLIKANKEEMNDMFLNLNFINIWCVGWCYTCLLVLFQPFITIWIGSEMLLTNIEMIFFCVYFYTWQFRVLGCNFKDAAGIWTKDVLKPYVASIVNILLNIYLVKRIGISGALISTIICMVFIYFPWETRILYRDLFKNNSKYYVFFQIKSFLLWSIIAIITNFICQKIELIGAYDFIVNCIICIILPNFLFAVIYHNNREFKYFYSMVRSRVSLSKKKVLK